MIALVDAIPTPALSMFKAPAPASSLVWTLELIGHVPAPVESRLIDYFSAKGSMVLTNVPGPRRTLSIGGTPLAGVLVWAPCSGSIGMSVSIFSYAGKVTVGFLTDAGLVPDPGSLADATRAEVLRLARYA